jgi:hypothetical protein
LVSYPTRKKNIFTVFEIMYGVEYLDGEMNWGGGNYKYIMGSFNFVSFFKYY